MKKTKLRMLLILTFAGMLVLAISIRQAASPTPPETEWDETYGTSSEERARHMINTNDGGYALVGFNIEWDQMAQGGRDFWLVKTFANGTMEWNQTYNGYIAAYSEPIVQTDGGGYAITGHNLSGSGAYELWLVKTDAFGEIEWSRSYGGEDDYFAGSVIRTSDGGYAIAAKKGSFYSGNQDVWLVKTDSSGNHEWNQTYGGGNNDIQYSLIQTSDGGYAVAGATNSYGAGDYDAWLFKTDSSGNREWNETYGGISGENAISVIQTEQDGGYAFAGYTHSDGAGGNDFWLVKTDSSGNHEWNQTYGGENYDHAWSVVQTVDGGYALAGETKSYGAGGYDAWIVKTNSTGDMEWNQTFGGTGFDAAHAVVQTDDGGYALAGYTNSFGAGGADFWLIKLAPEEIPATVDIDPDTLNLKSNGEWISGYIELPEDYSVENIEVSTILLNDTIGVDSEAPTQIGDYDSDGIEDLMVKFDRAEIIEWLGTGDYSEDAEKSVEATLTITGEVMGVEPSPFQGSDSVKVLLKE